MTMTMVENEILQKLYGVISEALQRPIEQMQSGKKIFVDFKIESVEALELEFAIEEAFDIQISPQDLWKLPSYLINNGYIEQGNFSSVAHSLIKERMPMLEMEEIAQMKNAKDLYKNIRIIDIAEFISKTVQE